MIAIEALETLIAMDVEQLEREIGFAEGFADPMPEAQEWLAALQEEMQERIAEQLS